MSKKESIKLNYKKSDGAVKHGVFESLLSADETDLRVMLAAVLLAEEDEAECDRIREGIELTQAEFDASVKYWCGAGLLKKKRRSASAKSEESTTQASSTEVKQAHRDGKLERKTELPSYTTAELNELIEKRRVTAEFIDEAQRVIGKIFNAHDVSILVGMVDYIGFDEASVIIILSHMVANGKKSLRYAEQMAFSLYDEGVTDVISLQNRLRQIEDYKKSESEVRAMFGMNGRALTTKEKKYLHAWIETMGFDVECIRLAYDITVDATHEPAPAYANSILEKWYSDGLRTVEDIKAAEEARKKGAATGRTEKSFDTDEFFDAALRRTFEEL